MQYLVNMNESELPLFGFLEGAHNRGLSSNSTIYTILWMKTGLWCGRWWFILLVPWYLLFYIIVREREVTQSCPTLCDPMDCSLPGSSVHGIFQAIVLEWIAISFSKGSSQPRDRTRVSRIVDRRFTIVQYPPFITHHNLF